jgi:hypothetical protein
MPTAVPSWAAVLMIPDALPRQRGSTSVPRPVAATEDTPMPAPAAAAQSGTAHARAASRISAASATAINVRPAAIRRRATCRGGPARRSTLAARVDPAGGTCGRNTTGLAHSPFNFHQG